MVPCVNSLTKQHHKSNLCFSWQNYDKKEEEKNYDKKVLRAVTVLTVATIGTI